MRTLCKPEYLKLSAAGSSVCFSWCWILFNFFYIFIASYPVYQLFFLSIKQPSSPIYLISGLLPRKLKTVQTLNSQFNLSRDPSSFKNRAFWERNSSVLFIIHYPLAIDYRSCGSDAVVGILIGMFWNFYTLSCGRNNYRNTQH